jgi:hypothetical protein
MDISPGRCNFLSPASSSKSGKLWIATYGLASQGGHGGNGMDFHMIKLIDFAPID